MEGTSTLARPYAVAVYDRAVEEGDVGRWSDMLGTLAAIVSDPAMAPIITDPRVPSRRLSEIILEIAEGQLSSSGENLVRVLAGNERLPLLPDIRDEFERRRTRNAGRSHVELISAFELEPRHEEMIAGAMAKRLGAEVSLSVAVDESLIGGVIIRVGDTVIDASLRGRLKQLEGVFD